MTKKVSFNIRLEADPSKLAEQELFARIVDEFEGTGTYLAMFFTEALLNWVMEQIANDFPPDVKATIEQFQTDASYAKTMAAEAVEEVAKAEREHERAMRGKVAQIADLEKQVEVLTERYHERGTMLTDEQKARAKNQERNDRYQLKLAAARRGFERMREFMVSREQQWQFAMDKVLKRD